MSDVDAVSPSIEMNGKARVDLIEHSQTLTSQESKEHALPLLQGCEGGSADFNLQSHSTYLNHPF